MIDVGRTAFATGDYAVGALTGAVTGAAVRAAIRPEWDMVLAMLAGMVIGMIVHLAIGVLASPLVGFFHFMVPGSLIGMYGGMMFAMRDTMQSHASSSSAGAVAVGAVFGATVVGVVRMYDRVLHARTEREERRD